MSSQGPGYLSAVALKDDLPEESYLRALGPIQYLMAGNILTFDHSVTMLVGENGSGKSTLLEGIATACGFNAEGGSKNFQFVTYPSHSDLGEHLTPIRREFSLDGFFLRAESFYNVATNIDEMEKERPGLYRTYGGRSLHKQSHGESFLALVQNRFCGHGLYLLDEPEAALSPSRVLTLLGEIHYLVQEHSQFIIATHSPILMAFPDAQIYQLSADGVQSVSYKETEHYQLTKRFLDDPERMLHYLFQQ